jgi:hypothetical protein
VDGVFLKALSEGETDLVTLVELGEKAAKKSRPTRSGAACI